MAHGLAARIAIYCAQCQTEGVLIRLLGNILHSRTAHLAKGSHDFGGRLILAKLLFTLNPSKVTDLDICPCSESSTRSFSTHRTVAVARELERVSNFVFDCATEATASNHLLPSNAPVQRRRGAPSAVRCNRLLYVAERSMVLDLAGRSAQKAGLKLHNHEHFFWHFIFAGDAKAHRRRKPETRHSGNRPAHFTE